MEELLRICVPSELLDYFDFLYLGFAEKVQVIDYQQITMTFLYINAGFFKHFFYFPCTLILISVEFDLINFFPLYQKECFS